MKTISSIFYLFFIGFFAWIVYLIWMTFFSDHVVIHKSVSVQEFRAEVNSTYYNPEEKMLEKLYTSENSGIVTDIDIKPNPNYEARPWETIEAFDNLENSSSQRALKKEFEHLLAMYLSVEDLYSKDELLKMKEYKNFYKILNIYVDYLQKKPNKVNRKLLYNIVDKNLKNFYGLIKNSNNLIDYTTSLLFLEKFLESLNCSNDFLELFKKYPLVKDELFFEKLKLSKRSYLEDWKSQLPIVQRENALFMEIMNRNHIYIDKMVNEIYSREVIALKDGSDKARKKYEEYIEHLKIKDGALSEEFIELWNLYVQKKIDRKSIDYIYVFVSGYFYSVQYHFDAYKRYKHVNEMYRAFLNGCEK